MMWLQCLSVHVKWSFILYDDLGGLQVGYNDSSTQYNSRSNDKYRSTDTAVCEVTACRTNSQALGPIMRNHKQKDRGDLPPRQFSYPLYPLPSLTPPINPL